MKVDLAWQRLSPTIQRADADLLLLRLQRCLSADLVERRIRAVLIALLLLTDFSFLVLLFSGIFLLFPI